MKKLNPLFVDSSIFKGESIGTVIELEGIMSYPEENVFVSIKTKDQIRKILLRPYGEMSCKGQIWLEHQESVEYQFSIERNEKEVFKSDTFSTKASYMILEPWEPVFDHNIAFTEF